MFINNVTPYLRNIITFGSNAFVLVRACGAGVGGGGERKREALFADIVEI
jgi:hypothetical protein